MTHSNLILDEPFSALIFDCDGTLVDTAPLHLAAINAGLKPLGLHMTEAWYYPRVGLTPEELFEDYQQHLGTTIDVKTVLAGYGPSFQSNLSKLREITVVADVARRYQGKVPMAVASNGHLANVELTLEVTGLRPLFSHIVSADEVPHGKPAPDVFLEAARRMNVSPADCIVFEDSDEGLQAAASAGMRTRDIRPAYEPQFRS